MARNFPIPWTPMKMDASSIHLLRLLSRENSARVYLIFGHLALVFGFLVAAPETGALIVTAIFFLLGFRWLRRYFSLVSWDPGLAYPVGFFYLGHTLLLFSLLLIRSSDAFGWCFLTTLGGLLLLLAHHMKQQNLQQFQEMVKLRDDPGTVIPKAVTLPEILRDEYFMEKSSTAALNTRQYYQMVLTNLRLIIFHTRKLSFQEIPLSEVEKLELFTSRWYLSFKAMLFIALNIFLVFFILAAVPVLCLLAFPLSLVLIVWKLRLVNVLVVHTREGSLWFSGKDFNAYFMKERVEGAIRENFSYQLKVPAYLHSQDPGQEKKGPGILHRLLNRLPRDKISQAGSSLLKPLGKELSLEQIRENRLIGSFYAPDMAPPDQPRISFGLPNFFNARELKQEKRWMKRWFRLAYSLLVFSVFFYYEPIGGIFVLLGLMAVVLFLVAWNKEGKIQIRREELEALRDFGVASWEKARVLKGDERFVENPDKPASGPNPGSSYQDWWKDKPWLLRRSLYVLGWGIIFLSLLTAKAENNGAYYLSGLLPGTILLMVYKFLSLRAEDKGLARFHQHEHHLLESLLPWLPEEMRNEESGFFTGLAAPLRRLRDWVDEFLVSMDQWLGDLGKKDWDLQDHLESGTAPGSSDARHFFVSRNFSGFYHRRNSYLQTLVVFVVVLFILAASRPAFGVRDASIRDGDLYSSENPGWEIRQETTEIDFMKAVYLSFRIYQDEAEDGEGYPAVLILISIKIPFYEITDESLVEMMNEQRRDWAEKEGVIVETETEHSTKLNEEGYKVHYTVYSGTSDEEETIFTKGRTMKVLGAVWHSEKNSLHVAMGFAQISNLTLNGTIIEDPPIPLPIPIPVQDPFNTTDETNWDEMFALAFKARTFKVS